MGRKLGVLLLPVLALLVVAVPALGVGDSGLWAVSQEYTLNLGGGGIASTTVGATFIGGYTAGRFSNLHFEGDYRLAFGFADRLMLGSGDTEAAIAGSYYLVNGNGAIGFELAEGLNLRLLAGARLWWGNDEYGQAYRFIQVRAGAGLVKSIHLGRVTLEAETDVYLICDYIADEADFGQAYLLQGFKLDGSLAAVFALDHDFSIKMGVRASYTADEGLFYPDPQSARAVEYEGWCGLTFSF